MKLEGRIPRATCSMDPVKPPLPELLRAFVASGDAVRVAYGHNYLFEERVAFSRQEAYEAVLALTGTELEAWRFAHRRYLLRNLYVDPSEVPETFSASNVEALRPPPAPAQWMVRVERLDLVLAQLGNGATLGLLEAQLATWRRGGGGDEAALRARQFLERFCEQWNEVVRRDHRPSFAAFEADVEAEIAVADWADRLRDRLGLSHYDPSGIGSPIPVALVRYRVREVLAACGNGEQDRAFAVPTVLDGELNAHFFPAPREAAYGRSLDLQPDESCERLVAEVLHRRIDYTPEHLFKVGAVTSPLPPHTYGRDFGRLRNGHLFCLRYETGREDFGADVPEGDDV